MDPSLTLDVVLVVGTFLTGLAIGAGLVAIWRGAE